jgi:energy-converting hydrogenase Eha subunit E
MKSSTNEAQKATPSSSRNYKKVVWVSLIAGLLLLITNSAVWVNRQIFNASNFTSIVTESITSESSRAAIAQNITDKIFAERPIAKRVAGDFSTKIIGGLLNTDQFSNVLSTAAERMQVYVTSDNQEDVTVELGAVKDIITQLTAVSESLGREASIDSNNIPDQILLIEEENVPDLYSVSVIMLWLAPVTLVGALLLLAYPYFKKWGKPNKILLSQGAIIIAVSFMGYLVGPLFRPPVLSQINVENRVVIGNLYDAFIATYNNQTISLTLIGLALIIIGLAWTGYPRARRALLEHKK